MWEAFFVLGAGRQFNETGVQPINYTDIITYMTENRIVEQQERLEFQHLLRVVDGKYIHLVQEKMARERERLMNKHKSGR